MDQFYLNPEAVLDKLDAQAAAIREKRDLVVQRFRDRLQAPKFADLLEGKGTSPKTDKVPFR